MNGLSLIAELRPAMPELKIIILSGFNEFDYLKEAMKYGIENYLLKPVNVQELKESLAGIKAKLASAPKERWQDNDVGILRDNILYRWMTGRIALSELKERAAFLQFDVNAPCYMTALLKLSDGMEAFGAQLLRKFESRRNRVLFRDFEGDLVWIFALDDDEAAKANAVKELHAFLHASPEDSRVRLAVGSVQRGAGGAAGSYGDAQKAQHYFLVRPGERLLDFEELEKEQEKHFFSVADLGWPDFVRLLQARNGAGLSELLAARLKAWAASEGIGPSSFRYAVVELFLLFRSEMTLARQSEQGDLYHEEIEQAGRASCLDEMINLAQSVGRKALEGLERDSKSPVVQQVLHRVHADYAEPLSLKSLGSELNIHPAYLGQLFQKELNSSFTDYLNRHRIQQAKHFLKESLHKVQEIAQLVGYVETGYFYKQFKKHVGISPMDYREMQ